MNPSTRPGYIPGADNRFIPQTTGGYIGANPRFDNSAPTNTGSNYGASPVTGPSNQILAGQGNNTQYIGSDPLASRVAPGLPPNSGGPMGLANNNPGTQTSVVNPGVQGAQNSAAYWQNFLNNNPGATVNNGNNPTTNTGNTPPTTTGGTPPPAPTTSPMAPGFGGGSTDPNVFTTPSYIKNLNQNIYAQQANQGQAPGFNQGQFDTNWNQYMQQGSGFNPDAFNKAMGTQDVTTPGWTPQNYNAANTDPRNQAGFVPAMQGETEAQAQARVAAQTKPPSPMTQPGANPITVNQPPPGSANPQQNPAIQQFMQMLGMGQGNPNFMQTMAQLAGPGGALGLGGGGFGNGLGGYGFGGMGNTFSPWQSGQGMGGMQGTAIQGPAQQQGNQIFGGPGMFGGMGGFQGMGGMMNPMMGGGNMQGVAQMLNGVGNLQRQFQMGQQPSPYGAGANPFSQMYGGGGFSPFGMSGGY